MWRKLHCELSSERLYFARTQAQGFELKPQISVMTGLEPEVSLTPLHKRYEVFHRSLSNPGGLTFERTNAYTGTGILYDLVLRSLDIRALRKFAGVYWAGHGIHD